MHAYTTMQAPSEDGIRTGQCGGINSEQEVESKSIPIRAVFPFCMAIELFVQAAVDWNLVHPVGVIGALPRPGDRHVSRAPI